MTTATSPGSDTGSDTGGATGTRAQNRAELTRAILTSASRQLAEVGPAALSVRAVARDLDLASSAVYRYFPSRDALITALLIRCYDDLGQAVEDADTAAARADLPARFRAAAGALRDWARAHPHEYALLYGSPVPGYAAPTDTVASATRVTDVLLDLVRDAQVAGLQPPGASAVSAAEVVGTAPVSAATEPPLDAAHTVRALGCWATLFGTLSLELFGHMDNAVLDTDAHWDQVVEQAASDLGLS